MFPPFPLLSKVIQELWNTQEQELWNTQEGEVIIIASSGPSQPWFPHLLRLGVDNCLIIPYCRDLLSQQGNVSDIKSYHLHKWRLSCSTTKQQVFQKRYEDSQFLEDPLETECMTIGGFAH